MVIPVEKILSDLIKMNSTNPPGNELPVAQYLKELFVSAGVESDIIEPEQSRASFIVRLGKGEKKLLYLAHSDVVPAGEGWDFEPFSGEIKDGLILGRGALDCKDLIAAEVSAALQLIDENTELKGELIIAVTADEEMGGKLGAGFLSETRPDLLQADYAINEGADQPIMIGDKIVYFFQVGEKGTAWCKLKGYGKAGHGSVPTLADNALVKVTRAVTRLNNYRAEVVVVPEVKKLLGSLAELCGIEVEGYAPEQVDDLLERLPLEKPFVEGLRSMTRMTVSPNQIHGGSKTNIIPDYCEADLDIRILPGQDRDYVINELRKVVGDELEIEFTEYREPTFSSASEPFYKLMEEVTLEVAGKGSLCLPLISSGSTDSKFLRGFGIPAYGIGHMARGLDPTIRTTIHGKNERTDVASLQMKTAFLKELARRYLI